jgi:hypothetical protein
MIGREQSKRLSITVSSGSGSGTITNQWDLARWVRVIPPSESDSYTLTIKDGDGHVMVVRTDQLGTFSEKLEMSLGIMRTVEISSASADGAYVAKFDIH